MKRLLDKMSKESLSIDYDHCVLGYVMSIDMEFGWCKALHGHGIWSIQAQGLFDDSCSVLTSNCGHFINMLPTGKDHLRR